MEFFVELSDLVHLVVYFGRLTFIEANRSPERLIQAFVVAVERKMAGSHPG